MIFKRRIQLMIASLIVGLALATIFQVAMATAVRTCPWHSAYDAQRPTHETWGGWFEVNGIPGPVGAEIKMHSPSHQEAASCFKVLIAGSWGNTMITNGSNGFQPGEPIEVTVDGIIASTDRAITYTGDNRGHSLAVTLEIPVWGLSFEPTEVLVDAKAGEFELVTITITNHLEYPSYFSSTPAGGWNSDCVWPTADTQNRLKPGESMTILLSVNGDACIKAGGLLSTLDFQETHPVERGYPVTIQLPVRVQIPITPKRAFVYMPAVFLSQ